jgi:hypothetical protein
LTVVVSAAPGEDHRTAFFEAAVPALAARGMPAAAGPLIVAGHITAGGRRPGGPAGRGKAFLDALHEDRKCGPKYRDLGAPAPLPDDTPRHVGGLALEVRPGAPETRYLIGTRLRVAGQLLAEVPVRCAAPNDIAGTSGERARIAAARLAFGQAVRTAFTQHSLARVSEVARSWCATIRSATKTTPGRPGSPRSAVLPAPAPGTGQTARPWRAGGRQLSPASPTPPSARPSGTSCGDDHRARHAAIQSTGSSAGPPERMSVPRPGRRGWANAGRLAAAKQAKRGPTGTAHQPRQMRGRVDRGLHGRLGRGRTRRGRRLPWRISGTPSTSSASSYAGSSASYARLG